jgi:hypothetical protein
VRSIQVRGVAGHGSDEMVYLCRSCHWPPLVHASYTDAASLLLCFAVFSSLLSSVFHSFDIPRETVI